MADSWFRTGAMIDARRTHRVGYGRAAGMLARVCGTVACLTLIGCAAQDMADADDAASMDEAYASDDGSARSWESSSGEYAGLDAREVMDSMGAVEVGSADASASDVSASRDAVEVTSAPPAVEVAEPEPVDAPDPEPVTIADAPASAPATNVDRSQPLHVEEGVPEEYASDLDESSM